MIEINNKVKKRIRTALIIFAIWLIAVLVMLFNIAVFNRDGYIEKGDNIAVRQFFIHPQRGAILDCNYVPLAWSVVYYDLAADAHIAEQPEMLAQVSGKLGPILPGVSTAFVNDEAKNGKFTVFSDLNPEQAEKLAREILPEFSVLSIVPRVERAVYDNPGVRNFIGTVENKENCLAGVSGAEDTYEKTLSGVATIYEIMVDKHGREIMDSYRELQPGVAGADVILPISINDIIAADSGRATQ